MAYATRNFKTKKELKEAVDKFNKGEGPAVTAYQPGPFGGALPSDGTVYLEGPHYPKPHTWYAQCEMKNNNIVKVK